MINLLFVLTLLLCIPHIVRIEIYVGAFIGASKTDLFLVDFRNLRDTVYFHLNNAFKITNAKLL